MSEVATTSQSDVGVMESVLADGDLSRLSASQRVSYYFKVCESLGLNPYTRPFDYITLNGKKVLYAKRDCTDQLRNIRGITLTVTDKRLDDDLYVVTVRATDAKGRSDEDFGAVPMLNLKGEARANAMLKAITKAKRRVTLSICGMGMNDESEIETLPGAVIENVELPPQKSPSPPTPSPNSNGHKAHSIAPPAGAPEADWRLCLDKVGPALAKLPTLPLVEATAAGPTCGDIMQHGPEWARDELARLLAENVARFPADETLEIVGQERMEAD
ncbi:MAG: hypothetical protein WAM53_15195 [Terrimicrobiaceae bacterium]